MKQQSLLADLDSIVIELGDSDDLKADSLIDLTQWSDTITISSPTGTNNFSGVYISDSTASPSHTWQFDDSSTISPSLNSGKLKLEGDDADIEINGRSVMAILDSIEQRLGLLKCREDLESEWEELKALGDQYRELQRKIEEKSRMWDTLKKMPPPKID